MLHIYLARHGQDEDNAAGVLNGRRDKPLTHIGKQQAEIVGEKIRKAGIKFDYIYVSPLLRTRQTAQIISDEVKGPKPHVLESLIERDFGVMSGKLEKDIPKICGSEVINSAKVVYFLKPENGETFPVLLDRAKRALEEITTKHKDGSILIVGHGDLGKMMYAAYYNLPWEEVLKNFHFGNSELLLLSPNSKAEDAHVFTIEQYN